MMDKIQSLLFKLAINISPVAHAKVVAAVIYKGGIVSIGICRYKTHPIQKMFGRTDKSIYLHAEVDALISATKSNIDLSRCTLYVLRVKRPRANSKDWVLGNSKPCDGCSRAIKSFNIKRVIYTEDE